MATRHAREGVFDPLDPHLREHPSPQHRRGGP
jgi:hypothetical protein